MGIISLTAAHQAVGEFVESLSGGSLIVITLVVSGPDFDTGETTETTLMVPLGENDGDAAQRLDSTGLQLSLADGTAVVEEPFTWHTVF